MGAVIIAAIALLLCLLPCLAQAGPAAAKDSAPLPEHTLPQQGQLLDNCLYAGFECRCMSIEFAYILGASAGMGLVTTAGRVLAFDLASGKLAWQYVQDLDRGFFYSALFDNGRVYLTTWQGDMVALRMADGAELWTAGGGPPVAAGEDKVWLQDYARDSIVLADGATRQVLRRFTDCDFPESQSITILEADYAIKAHGMVRILLPDATEVTWPSPRPDWAALFGYGPDWLLEGEFPDFERWQGLSEKLTAQIPQAALSDPATGQPGAS